MCNRLKDSEITVTLPVSILKDILEDKQYQTSSDENFKEKVEEKFKDFIYKYLDEDGRFLGEKICGSLEDNNCEDCEFDCRNFLIKTFKEEILN